MPRFRNWARNLYRQGVSDLSTGAQFWMIYSSGRKVRLGRIDYYANTRQGYHYMVKHAREHDPLENRTIGTYDSNKNFPNLKESDHDAGAEKHG